MALQKTPIDIPFNNGIDTKTDPKRVQLGKFLALNNSVFDKAGSLVKRNGYPLLTKLPNALQTTLTTLNSNLIATGSNLYAYSSTTDQWLNQGSVQPVNLSTQSLVRVSTSQSSPDAATTADGLTCVVYMDNSVGYYQINNSETGQQIVGRTSLGSTSTNPRVFILDRYFIITYTITPVSTPVLKYIAIPISTPASPMAAADISTDVLSLTAGYDAYVVNNGLYISWAGSSTVKTVRLSNTLIQSSPVSIASSSAQLMSVCSDSTYIYVSFWTSTGNNGFIAIYDLFLNPILAKTSFLSGTAINTMTSVASNGVVTLLYENDNTYGFSPNAKTDYISKQTVTVGGTVSSPSVVLRSVGLASKAFIDEGSIYVLATYGEVNQPTYFLIDTSGNIIMRLAYGNGGGYATTQVLPNVTLQNDTYSTPYLIKDFLASVNKTTDLASGTPVNAIYTQTGVNLVKFQLNITGQYSAEIANSLNLTGGMMWQYDGVKPVEQGFHVYPENITATTSGSGGNITAQQYYYVFCYEWTDGQGNLHRSAPSIPVSITTTGATSTNTLNVPTLRLTYKTSPNPVRIVGYRWSVAQQTYYQFTSLTSPTVNNPAVDSVTITDTLADSAILGNTLLYTTGGVVENIAPPAAKAIALYGNRVFIVDAENPNLIWYSKQIVQNTPVEFSDLFTIYVAPTSGAQGSTGVVTAISAMDDKFIIFKRDAIYYVTGQGPDNTGANNNFSEPIFITSAVGTANPNSIVLTPDGLMFQSDKGIWLLGRNLATMYIGAPVEAYNDYEVKKAQVIPATNQVRFILNNKVTLMYDFYYQQWGTHSNLNAISACLYQGSDTYINNLGYVYKQQEGTYLDGSQPVLMSFTTSWISLAGVQGLERFYEMYLVGTYYSPFKLNVKLSYDYNPSAVQNAVVTPDNYGGVWGGSSTWGASGGWGGHSNVFEARVFPSKQKCETFQVTVEEVYDPSYGVVAGQGLNMSGLNIIVGAKRGYRTNKSSQSFS